MNTFSLHALKQRFSRKFLKDTAGNVAMIASLSVIPIISVLGLAVDFQLVVTKKNLVQQTLDATMIAVARERQAGRGGDSLEDYVDEYFNSLIQANAPSLTCIDRPRKDSNGNNIVDSDGNTDNVFDVVLRFDTVGEGVNGTVNCSVATTLSGLLGREEVSFEVEAGSTFGIGLIDVAMVFDVSGSMGDIPQGSSVSKIAGLKVAATTATNALITDDPLQTDQVRISIVPFDHTVNVDQYFTDFTGLDPENRTYPREEPVNLRSRFTDIRLAEAREELDELNSNSENNQQLQQQIDDIIDDINELTNQLDALRDEFNRNRNRIFQLARERNRTRNRNRRNQLQNQINDLNNTNNRIANDFRALSQRRDTFIRNRNRLQAQLGSAQNDREARELEQLIQELENGGGLEPSEECNAGRQENCIVDDWIPSTGIESGTCVTERGSNAYAFTDDNPRNGDIDSLLRGQGHFWFTTASDEKKFAAHFGTDNGFADGFTNFGLLEPANTAINDLNNWCQPNEISLLSDDKTQILSDIDNLQVNAGTSTHLGLAVGWYTLSPEWGSIFPDANTGHSYTQQDATKVVILMTDGETRNWTSEDTYEDWELPNVPGRELHAPHIADQPTNAGEERTIAICDNMKARGIAIYAVAFDAPDRAAENLRACASTGDEFFQVAEDNDELEEVFAEIANSISDLRIKN